ncbi:hypothetical protein ACKUZO_004340 [Acinetobacter baumannii]
MSFDRFRFQKEVEILLGCHQVEKWLSYSQKFQSLEVNMSNIQTLKSSLHEDGLDNLYKGLYSISNGFLIFIMAITRGASLSFIMRFSIC